MELSFEKETHDVRGKIIFLTYGDKRLNIVEIKKGFSRGGHYHPFDSKHVLISGKIKYREKNLKTDKEMIQEIVAPATISVPSDTAHILTAIEDVIFIEEFLSSYTATDYPEYRNIVKKDMT